VVAVGRLTAQRLKQETVAMAAHPAVVVVEVAQVLTLSLTAATAEQALAVKSGLYLLRIPQKLCRLRIR
jgi:hypothetical protein